MNLTNEEKEYIKARVAENFNHIEDSEYQKICDEEKKLILSSDIFKHFETEVFMLLINCGYSQLNIMDGFQYNTYNGNIILRYVFDEIGINYEKRFSYRKLNKEIRSFDGMYLTWYGSEYDSLFSKTFIEVKDLKTKATRLSVIDDIIDKISKEIITEYRNKGKNHLKDLKDVLPLLNITYYPNFSK